MIYTRRSVGVVGLGKDGAALTERLRKAGHLVSIYDLDPTKSLARAGDGVKLCTTPRELSETCSTVLLVLDSSNDVESIAFDDCGLLSGVSEEMLIIDLSATRPELTRGYVAKAARLGGRWIDAYWSGKPSQRHEAQDRVLVGGLSTDVCEAAALFISLGCQCSHVGAVGSAHTLGLIEETLVGCQHAIATEVSALASASGLNFGVVREQLSGGVADTSILERCAMSSGQAPFADQVDAISDSARRLQNVRYFAESVDARVPITTTVLEMQQWAARVVASREL